MKINQIPTLELVTKRNSLLKTWVTEYTITDEKKKVVKTPGKGDESPSLYFRHVSEELARRGQL
jgi:hypothetical protein